MESSAERLGQMFGIDDREGLPVPLLHRDTSDPRVKRIPVATVPKDLSPLIKIEPGTRSFIVGTDGANVKKEGYKWLGDLAGWLQEGCSIDYLLLDPGAATLACLWPLVASGAAGKLQVFVMKPENELSPEALNYRDLWETFHFAGFESEARRQLWLEGCHNRGEITARDCVFYPQETLTKPGIFDIYKSQFDFVLESHANPVDFQYDVTELMELIKSAPGKKRAPKRQKEFA